ncbi:contact-dependent growth inhibition system immunity protein [Streptomyces sp. NPDC085540]|uniref:contact-dependent growth inhibition system immunity protein n=1 Tax=Streptomyces sp. NPDC085540 TaxID=3365730 RepID=UPI0037D86CC1
MADQSEGEEAVELGEDARRLLVSELPEQVLHAVWLASTGNTFDPTGHGMTCRAWLERISEQVSCTLIAFNDGGHAAMARWADWAGIGVNDRKADCFSRPFRLPDRTAAHTCGSPLSAVCEAAMTSAVVARCGADVV